MMLEHSIRVYSVLRSRRSGGVAGRMLFLAGAVIAGTSCWIASAAGAEAAVEANRIWPSKVARPSEMAFFRRRLADEARHGRLVGRDPHGGLFRVSVGNDEAATKVEPIDVPLVGAQGLVWSHDRLYESVNGGGASFRFPLYGM